MKYETIECELRENAVLLVRLNRPDRLNAFTSQMCIDLVQAFEVASSDDDVAAIVVTGSGRAFCAGMDLDIEGNVFGLDESVEPDLPDLRRRLQQQQPSAEAAEILDGVRDSGGRLTLAIRACRKPVVAAINGAAVGIGATMTLAMDVRLMAQDAKMGFVFGRLGIVPEACSTWYLPRLVGLQRALEWCYAAEPFDAAEALSAGLVRSVHAPDTLLDDALALAVRFTQHRSRAATALAREMLYRGAGRISPEEAHLVESLGMHFLSQRDGREGVAAFLEKRRPSFRAGTASEDFPPGFPWRD